LTPIAAHMRARYPGIPEEPSILDMRAAFEPVDALLAHIEAGELTYEQNTPVLIIGDTACEICPAMAGWVETFERIAIRLGTPIDLSPLIRIGKKLSLGIMLEESDLARAKLLVDRCRAIYLACPTHHRVGATNETLISVELERMGLIKE